MKNRQFNDYEIATGTIQRLLYEKPLYNYVDKENVNVVVFGFTLLCQRFIDIAFELSQVNGYKLNILVVSNDDNAKQEFLNTRPAFTQFFDIDNNEVKNSYGHLSFQKRDLNKEIDDDVSDVLLDEASKFAYLFVDLGDDEKNTKVASACSTCGECLYHTPTICCVLSETKDLGDSLNLVLRDETIQTHPDFNKIKRMAFNCHLLWCNSELEDIRKLQRNFNSEYNFSSSLSNVLSIQYKLNSVGIDITSPDAAEQYYQIVASKDAASKKKISELIQLEHQRWNVNMICNGWTPMTDLSKCLDGRKDKNKKQHPCLVPCDANVVLENAWKLKNYDKWNTATKSEIAQLDPLDQVSVKIHRIFKEKAEEIKKSNLIPDNDIYEVRKQLQDYPVVEAAFSKYVLCVRGINTGLKNQIKLYNYYKAILTKALKTLPTSTAKLITKRIETIETVFYPILESEKYIDYKAIDSILIKRIPFILTYKTNLHIAVPMNIESGGDKNNQMLFSNVASVLQIKPSSVTCFCQFTRNAQTQIKRALEYMVNSLKSHNITTRINVCLICEKNAETSFVDEIIKISSSITRIDVLEYQNEDDLELEIREFIKQRRIKIIEKNNSPTSNLLYGLRCYRHNPYYTFDSSKRTLMCFNGCDFLKYVPFKPYLKISDLFVVKGSVDSRKLPDFQNDYTYFWNLYKKSGRKSERIWKCFCNALSKTNDNENTITISLNSNSNVINRDYYIESCYVDSVNKILGGFKKSKDTTYEVQFYSNGVYKITITAPLDIHSKLNTILANPYLLSNPFDLEVSADWKSVKVVFTNLIVNKFYVKTMNEEDYYCNEMVNLLKKLKDENYILNLQNSSDNNGEYYSFCYSSHQVKSVLTNAGRILELFVYYKALENGGFDEVANSVEVLWNEDNVENEFDIILTNGLRSIVIECKAQTLLKQDFYYKLFMLNKEFGINSVPVIIADTCENLNNDNSVNDMQRSRGNEIGIKTIYQRDDISNIGNVLKSLLKSN